MRLSYLHSKFHRDTARGTITDQESVARQIIGPRDEPTTIILLNMHVIKLTPNDVSLYPEVGASFTLTRETSFSVDGDWQFIDGDCQGDSN